MDLGHVADGSGWKVEKGGAAAVEDVSVLVQVHVQAGVLPARSRDPAGRQPDCRLESVAGAAVIPSVGTWKTPMAGAQT